MSKSFFMMGTRRRSCGASIGSGVASWGCSDVSMASKVPDLILSVSGVMEMEFMRSGCHRAEGMVRTMARARTTFPFLRRMKFWSLFMLRPRKRPYLHRTSRFLRARLGTYHITVSANSHIRSLVSLPWSLPMAVWPSVPRTYFERRYAVCSTSQAITG